MRRALTAQDFVLSDQVPPSLSRAIVRSSRPDTILARLSPEQVGITLFYCGCGVEAPEEGIRPGPVSSEGNRAHHLNDAPVRLSLEEQLQVIERRIIEESLRRNNYRRSDTARELGISRVTLYNKMKRLGILAKRRNHITEVSRP